MFERLAGQTITALHGAIEEARTMRHEALTAAHLLLGLYQLRQGAAREVLVLSGVYPDALRIELKKAMGKPPLIVGNVRMTVNTKKILEVTVKRTADRLIALAVPEDLLLALLQCPDEIVVDVVTAAGVRWGAFRDQSRTKLMTSGWCGSTAALEHIKDIDLSIVQRLSYVARSSLHFAVVESERKNNKQICTKQVLLALLQTAGDGILELLRECNLTFVELKKALETGSAVRSVEEGDTFRFSDEAVESLRRANQESIRGGSAVITSLHLFAGVLTADTQARSVLRNGGVNTEELCSCVLQRLSQSSSAVASAKDDRSD